MKLFGSKKREKAAFDVKGMTCHHCAATVKRQLEAIPGVKEAAVSLEDARAVVTYDPDKVAPADIVNTFNETSPYQISRQ